MILLTNPTQTLEFAKTCVCLVSQKLNHTAGDDMIDKDILFTPPPPTTLTILYFIA